MALLISRLLILTTCAVLVIGTPTHRPYRPRRQGYRLQENDDDHYDDHQHGDNHYDDHDGGLMAADHKLKLEPHFMEDKFGLNFSVFSFFYISNYIQTLLII